MNPEEVLARLKPWRQKNERACWIPLVTEGDGSLTDSKFSGLPWLDSETTWPPCKICAKQMQFFLQLNLDKLPQELNGKYGSGLLQLFYCTRDNCQGEGGWEPFENTMSCVRVVHPQGKHIMPERLDEQEEVYPVLSITGWEKEIDFPSAEEHDTLGLEYEYKRDGPTNVKCKELNFDQDCEEDGELAETISSSRPDDKLAGWPYWIQGVEYPSCTECGETMILLFQVDSEVNIPFMFGDSGCGHITQCPKHKNVVAFGWACG